MRRRDDPELCASCCPSPTRNSGGRAALLYSLCSVDFLPPSYSLDGRFEGPTPFIGQLASAPRCAATSLLLRSCTVVLTIKRWDAPRPVSLTRGFKGHTPFIRPVFETASAASCLCHQVRLGLLSGWTMNAWSRFARQKEERTSSALTRRFELRTTTPTASYCGNPSAPCLKAPEIIPSHAQAAARPPTHNSGGRAARLYSL